MVATKRRDLNPPFHPSIKDLGFWSNKSLERGYFVSMSQISNTVSQTDGVRINFLYNPSVLSFSHQGDTSNLNSGYTPGGGPTAALSLGTVTFDLLFDRTYELAYGWGSKGSSSIGSPAIYGTSVDAEAIRDYVGIRPENSTGMNPSKDFQSLQQVFTHFFFGTTQGALTFYGIITSLDLEVTHWTQKMVPQRCTVSLQVTLMPFGYVPAASASTPSPSPTTGPTNSVPAPGTPAATGTTGPTNSVPVSP